MYVVKTSRLVGQLCEGERPRQDVLYIWKRTENENEEETDLVYCLTSLCILSFNPTTGAVVSQINHPSSLELPPLDNNLIKVQVAFRPPDLVSQPDRIYCVTKQIYNISEEKHGHDSKGRKDKVKKA